MKRFCLLLLGVLATTQCGGGGGGTGPTPNTIAVSAGNDQVGAAGTALAESLAVIVKDQSGAVLSGVTVNFAVTAGGGSVSPASRVTNAAGIAKTRRTLGPNAGTQTVSAGASNLTPVQFSAVSQINGAVNIANSTTGPLTDTVGAVKAESLAVLVADQNAAPIQGINVAWASVGGLVSAASVPTSAAGVSKVRFTYGTSAVAQSATATVTGLVGSPVTVTLTATAGTAVSIAKTVGDNGTTGPSSQVTYTLQSRDSHGNPKGGVTIDWAVDSGGGSITPPQNTTAANGNATATRTLGGGVGVQTATAAAAGLTGAPQVKFRTTAAIITTVEVSDFQFSPSTINGIPLGTTITWAWQGTTALHNVTFDAGAGVPPPISNRTSGTGTATFNSAGTFPYHCTNHPQMTGSVTVNP
jgi:plastocyanin